MIHIAYVYRNFLKFNDSKWIINKAWISLNCYCIDVIWKSFATTFLSGAIKTELHKTYFLDDLMKPQYALENEGFNEAPHYYDKEVRFM